MTSMQRDFHHGLLGVVLAAVTLVGPAAHAQDWPAFRGPTGQGHSSERGLPLEWSESTNVIWKTPVPGRGWSSPVVASGRVWLTTATAVGAGSLRLLAYDGETGVRLMLSILRAEFDKIMAYSGSSSVDEITEDMVIHAGL